MFLCWLGLHSWQRLREYTSLGTLSYCRRCQKSRWTK